MYSKCLHESDSFKKKFETVGCRGVNFLLIPVHRKYIFQIKWQKNSDKTVCEPIFVNIITNKSNINRREELIFNYTSVTIASEEDSEWQALRTANIVSFYIFNSDLRSKAPHSGKVFQDKAKDSKIQDLQSD